MPGSARAAVARVPSNAPFNGQGGRAKSAAGEPGIPSKAVEADAIVAFVDPIRSPTCNVPAARSPAHFTSAFYPTALAGNLAGDRHNPPGTTAIAGASLARPPARDRREIGRRHCRDRAGQSPAKAPRDRRSLGRFCRHDRPATSLCPRPCPPTAIAASSGTGACRVEAAAPGKHQENPPNSRAIAADNRGIPNPQTINANLDLRIT